MIRPWIWVVFLLVSLRLEVAYSQRGICLSLLVKSEAPPIEPCLSSVKDVVDCITVCDGEAQETTLKLIQKFAEQHRIPLKIHSYRSTDDINMRTLGFKNAQELLKQEGFSLVDSYVLIFDAHMTLHISHPFKKASLEAPAYLVAEKSKALCSYRYHAHLLQASLPWESRGLLGKDWTSPEAHRSVKLKTWLIETSEPADLNLQSPQQEELLFYLSQAHQCLKNFQQAIALYKARLEKGGNPEEVWFSKYMLGKCYEEQGDWQQALHWYLEAYQHNPSRTESLVKVATYYRWRGRHDLAHLFAKYGSGLPSVDDQLLFDLIPETNHHFDEELSIASYYTRFKEDGFTALSNLSLRRHVPWYTKEQAYRNLIFYAPNLISSRVLPIDIPLPSIEQGSQEKYRPTNPSIVKTVTGYLVNCRAVNYTQVGANIFTPLESSGIFRTKNFLVSYDQNWNRLSQEEIVDTVQRPSFRACNVEGLEDCRLVAFQGDVWFSCTTSDTNPTGQRQISLCKLDKNGQLQSLIPLKGPDLHRCEKNWLPFVKDGRLLIVYGYDPFIIYEPDLMSGECKTIFHHEPAHDLSRFRGSAGPLEFQGGYLMLVHEVMHHSDWTRVYFHRFLFLDRHFKIQKASRPFTFQHFGVEFCCSMAVDHRGEELILAIGIEDREAYLYFVNLASIEPLLYPLP